MRRFLGALVLSLSFHGLVALALAAYLTLAEPSSTCLDLDLSQVEFSLSEEEDEMSEARSVLPSASPSVQSPELAPPHPPLVPTEMTPPDPLAISLTEPEEPCEMPPLADSPAAAERPRQESAASAPLPAPRQARVDAPPRPTKAIRPEYPRASRRRGEEGDVGLEIRVNAHGGVDEVAVVSSSGFDELDRAAVRAARNARFSPARSSEGPVGATALLTLRFRLK